MLWIVVTAWALAALLAMVVLGFCAYEIVWKTKRLKRDLGSLQGLTDQLADLSGQLADARARVAATGLR